jgi:hypothetical protein
MPTPRERGKEGSRQGQQKHCQINLKKSLPDIPQEFAGKASKMRTTRRTFLLE